MSNHATKKELKNAIGIDASSFVKKADLASLKSDVDKLDIDKLLPVPVDLSKLSDIVKNDVVKKDVYNAKIKNIKNKIPDITNLATKNNLNAKIGEVKGEIPSITNLATKNTFNAAENKTPSVSNSVKKTITQKLMRFKRKLLIIIMINILLPQNLISYHLKILLRNWNKLIEWPKLIWIW